MFQAATLFSGGMLAADAISRAMSRLPQFVQVVDEGQTCRLHVRVVSASIPGLASPGMMMRDRPRLEVILGGTRKMTEFAEFRQPPEAGKEDEEDVASNDYCWHFGETLTFIARISDLLGPGVQLWLRSYSDVNLGVLQVNLSQMHDIGTCGVDFRRDILPACVPHQQGSQDATPGSRLEGLQQLWETPAFVLPLAHVSADGSPHVLAEAAAHLTVTFAVTGDPQELLKTADLRSRPFSEHASETVMKWCDDLAMWIADGNFLAACNNGSGHIDEAVERIEATCWASCRSAGLDKPVLVESVDASTAASFQTSDRALTMDTVVQDLGDVQDACFDCMADSGELPPSTSSANVGRSLVLHGDTGHMSAINPRCSDQDAAGNHLGSESGQVSRLVQWRHQQQGATECRGSVSGQGPRVMQPHQPQDNPFASSPAYVRAGCYPAEQSNYRGNLQLQQDGNCQIDVRQATRSASDSFGSIAFPVPAHWSKADKAAYFRTQSSLC